MSGPSESNENSRKGLPVRHLLLLIGLLPICVALMVAPLLLLVGLIFGSDAILNVGDVLGNPVSWVRAGWAHVTARL